MQIAWWLRLVARLAANRRIVLEGETDGTVWPWPSRLPARKAAKRLLRLGEVLRFDVEAPWDEASVRFRCRNWTEVWRAATALSKEPGTVRWIRETLGPGDVFYDVGANVGIFTVLAAARVAPGGRVVAFEPHCGNFARLLENVSVNGLARAVIPCSAAVGGRVGFFGFEYASAETGSSGSRLSGGAFPETEGDGLPRELKSQVTLDALIESAQLPRPTHVKIDVDGLEEDVLAGLEATLSARAAPAWVQVEIAPGRDSAVCERLHGFGYELQTRHRSFSEPELGAGQVEDGAEGPYNALFRRTRSRRGAEDGV